MIDFEIDICLREFIAKYLFSCFGMSVTPFHTFYSKCKDNGVDRLIHNTDVMTAYALCHITGCGNYFDLQDRL